MSRKRRSTLHGVLVVDKPSGMTSHDVVSCARRALGTRTIGHAGTLDPMATGVLVLGVGEGTKLLTFLSADDKVYRATLSLGAETDSLDADGVQTETMPVPRLSLDEVTKASRAFVGSYLQRAPRVSALKKDGVALHERVRRGEDVEAPERPVCVHELLVQEVREAQIDLEVHAAKGFYVRSLARDLARALGTCGHLCALRRLRSGAFDESDALDGATLVRARSDEQARALVRAALRSMSDAARGMQRVRIDEAGVVDARHGRIVRAQSVQHIEPAPAQSVQHIEPAPAPSVQHIEPAPAQSVQHIEPAPGAAARGPLMLLDAEGQAIAIASWHEGDLRIVRGFVQSEAEPSAPPPSGEEASAALDAGLTEGQGH